MGRLNLLLCVALLTTSACVFKWLGTQPESDLRAVTDGKLTLGVVPSRDEQNGTNAYRLLLCKKGALQAQHFDNSSFCRAALRDASGAEVVLLANERRRSFAAKYGGYTAALAGAALAAVGVHQGVKWAKLSSKRAKDISSLEGRIHSSEELAEAAEGLVKNAQAEEKKLEELSQKIPELEELRDGLVNANPKKVKKAISKFKERDADLGERLQELINGSDEPLDSKLMAALIERAEQTDKIFARQLKAISVHPHVSLGKDGVRFYRSSYGTFVGDHETLMKQLAEDNDLMKTPEFVENLTNALSKRQEGAQLLESATELGYLERYYRALNVLDSLDKKAQVRRAETFKRQIDAKKNMEFDIDPKLAENFGIKINPNDDFPTKFEKVQEAYKASKDSGDYSAIFNADANIDDYNKHAAAAEIEDLFFSGIDDFNSIRHNQAYLQLYGRAMNPLGERVAGWWKRVVRPELNKLDKDISQARQGLLSLESLRLTSKNYAPQVEGFWGDLDDLLGEADELVQQKKHTRLRRLIDEFEEGINARKEDLKNLDEMKSKHAELSETVDERKHIIAAETQKVQEAEKEINELEKQLDNIKNGNTEEAKQAIAEQKKRKRNTLIAGGGAAVLGTTAAVALSLDESIWGHGEKAIGKKYWQQIFVADKGFANPLPVNNLPEIVRQIAQVFGKEVNQSAFDLR